MQYFPTYLIYLAVVARAIGGIQDSAPIPVLVWILLGVFGLFLFSQEALTQRWAWYPRGYILVQSCLVIGMGVPTGAAYLMIAIVLGPVLHKLGLSLMAAHLFVVYFGVLSVVTPPVALAAFAAAPIAEAKPMETGLQATRLAIAGFIIPYLFVFHPDLLLVAGDLDFAGLAWALFVFCVSTWGIVTGLGGWEWNKLPFWQRSMRLLAAVLLIIPGVPSGLAGGGAVGRMPHFKFAVDAQAASPINPILKGGPL